MLHLVAQQGLAVHLNHCLLLVHRWIMAAAVAEARTLALLRLAAVLAQEMVRHP